MANQSKLTRYRRKFGNPPSKQGYTHGRCEHNSTHVERTDGVRYAVCDACRTIRDNELNARLENRAFRGQEELAQAA